MSGTQPHPTRSDPTHGHRRARLRTAAAIALFLLAGLVCVSALLVALSYSGPAAHAATVLTQGDPATPALTRLFNNIRTLLMGLLGSLTLLVWTISAIRYGAARDNTEEVMRAKDGFRHGAYGFIAAVFAPVLVEALKWICGVR